MSLLALLCHPVLRGIRTGLLCALASWLLVQATLFNGVEDWLLDGFFSWRGKRHTSARIVIIALDAPSLASLPKSRDTISPELAEVVTFAHDQGARAIGVDVMIPEDRDNLPELQLGQVGDPWKMGQAVQRAGNVTLPLWRLPNAVWLRPLETWRFKADHDYEVTDLGFVNLTEDRDQFIRRQQLVVKRKLPGQEDEQFLPSLALALYARALGQPIDIDDLDRLIVGNEVIPTEANYTIRINYVGPPGQNFEQVPFQRALELARAGGHLPELDGAVVLIAITARDQQDYHSTPYANNYTRWTTNTEPGQMCGVEIHANVLATLFDRARIYTPVWLMSLPWLLAMGVVLGWCFSRLSLEAGFVLALVHHFAWKGIAFAAFIWFNWRVEMGAMLLLGFLAYSVTFALRWRDLRRMFGVVKSESLARALEADPRRLDPGGEERVVTVLFADIRSFTVFAEKHTASQVVTLLNAYFAAVVPVIEAEGGVIDKFMGDGIMALFGAPATLPDHAARAARAAVAMVLAVHERRALWERLDVNRAWCDHGGLRIGVGVHTGPVVIGAIGGPGRLDYTAIGDTVNAAARIESENKEQGTEVLLSATTRALLSAEEQTRLGLEDAAREVVVKGKEVVLRLFAARVP